MTIVVMRMLEALLLPPGGLLLLALVGILLAFRSHIGRPLAFLAVVALWLLSLPGIADALLGTLEKDLHPAADAATAGAIVVLGGGRHGHAAEYGGDTVSASTLERLRYAATLHRTKGLPVVASGGAPYGESVSGAELMRQVLEVEFGVDPVWTEGSSADTRQNARLTAALLAEREIDSILLVTHAWHMRRSLEVFREAGVSVIPAPTLFATEPPDPLLRWLPNAEALLDSQRALHEWLGILWYRVTPG